MEWNRDADESESGSVHGEFRNVRMTKRDLSHRAHGLNRVIEYDQDCMSLGNDQCAFGLAGGALEERQHAGQRKPKRFRRAKSIPAGEIVLAVFGQ